MENRSMTPLAELLPSNMESSQILSSDAEILAQKVVWLNEEIGNLTGYDCPLCKNRGDIAYAVDREIVYRPCKCMEIRQCMKNIQKSGLEPLLAEKTFDSYEERNGWQAFAKRKVWEYAHTETGAWLVLAGCPGSGKTHLCTAACGELLRKGAAVRYMLWLEELQELLAVKNDERYRQMMNVWKRAEILYIDDLFKIKNEDGQKKNLNKISDPVVRLAFELINTRYMDPKKRTIISTEWKLEEIIGLDEGLGGRLREKSKGYYFHFSGEKDWRLR